MTLTVALLQLDLPDANPGAALPAGLDACRRAAQMGADVLLFPEMWSIGCRFFSARTPQALARWQQQALPRESAFLRAFQDAARALHVAVAITCLEAWHDPAGNPLPPRNSLMLFDRHGAHVLTYAKVHTCDFGDEAFCTPGAAFVTAPLDTARGVVQVGAMICFDREFPESARTLMLQGAELLLVPNACTLEINRLSQLRARAFENMTAIALANYPAPFCNGHSVAFDGIAFAGGTAGQDGTSRDMRVVEAGEAPGICLAPFDLAALRAYRARESWGDAYRRPRAYGALTTPEARPPFLRPDARR